MYTIKEINIPKFKPIQVTLELNDYDRAYALFHLITIGINKLDGVDDILKRGSGHYKAWAEFLAEFGKQIDKSAGR